MRYLNLIVHSSQDSWISSSSVIKRAASASIVRIVISFPFLSCRLNSLIENFRSRGTAEQKYYCFSGISITVVWVTTLVLLMSRILTPSEYWLSDMPISLIEITSFDIGTKFVNKEIQQQRLPGFAGGSGLGSKSTFATGSQFPCVRMSFHISLTFSPVKALIS